MAKTNIFFNDKNYIIDDSSLSFASSSLKSHFSTVMNGTGAVINFDGITYNIDSEKLSNTRNNFVAHLDTISGDGHKVTVNGIEYSIDSTKISNAISDLKNTLIDLQPKSNKDTWEVKTWNTYSDFTYGHIWTDGENVYCSNDGNGRYDVIVNQYVLNKDTGDWEPKTWNWDVENVLFSGAAWSYGGNIYCNAYIKTGGSATPAYFMLNKETNTWSLTTFDGLRFNKNLVFTDGENTYASDGTTLYILNKDTDMWDVWKETIWNESFSFNGVYLWADRGNIYYSNGTTREYVLNKETNIWEPKIWYGYTDLWRAYIWSDGNNVYCSEDSTYQYVLNRETDTWEPKTWNGYSNFTPIYMWTDGENIYRSEGNNKHYVLV